MTGMPVVRAGSLAYEWRERDPSGYAAADEWSHPGLATDEDGSILAFDPTRSTPTRLDGTEAWPSGLPDLRCGHSLAISGRGRARRLWITDPGRRARLVDGAVVRTVHAPRVVALDATGRPVVDLGPPDDLPFRPTAVAVREPADGGDGGLWVADGYGSSRVHRHAPDGRWLGTLDGSETGRVFDCPHAIFVDQRGGQPRLLVADRGNARVVAYDLDGSWLGTLADGAFSAPSGFAASVDQLVVADLHARLEILDADDRLVGVLGDGGRRRDAPGWPNAERDGQVVRPEPEPGRFSSPHGLAITPDGSIYVAEWVVGGRLVELRPRGQTVMARPDAATAEPPR